MITQETLKKKLRYNPETGKFYRVISSGGFTVGSEAGCLRPDGYFCIRVDRKLYLASRLAWLYVHGELPYQIDHINRNTKDDRISNLRKTDDTKNHANIDMRPDNKSGFKGVCWNKALGKWVAGIRVNGKSIHLGVFTNPIDAARAYDAAAHLHFKEFALTNEMLGRYTVAA